MKIKLSNISIFLLLILCGCGMFKSTTKTDTRTDSTSIQTKAVDLSEFESLQANIPASYIKSITTPSGMKIELRDSVLNDGGRGTDDRSDGLNPSNDLSNAPHVESDSKGSISISYSRKKEKRDNTATKTQKEQQKSELKETEVEASGAWLTWLFIGIAVALALIVAAILFFKGGLL